MKHRSLLCNILSLFVNKLTLSQKVNIKGIENHSFIEKSIKSIKTSYSTNFDVKIHEQRVIKGSDKVITDILNNNNFISKKIVSYIKNSTFLYYNLRNKLNNVRIFIPVDDKKIPKLNRLFHIIEFMRILGQYKNHLDFEIFYINFNKEIDELAILGPEHVNGGACWRGKNITIWRQEELEKVLIHEMIHFMELDFFHQIGLHYFNQTHGINNVKIWESYTDSLAIILHTLMISFYTNQSFEKLMENEIKFVLCQSAKVLDHYNIKSIMDIKGKMQQNTDVFSYYIVKSAILYSITDLLKFLEHDITCLTRSKEWLNLCINVMNNPAWHLTIEDMISYIRSIKKNNYLSNTLRMTHLELN